MIPILYDKSEINFSSLGLGKMTETLSSVTTEIANGTYENITIYSANGKLAELIDNEMQIKVKPNDRDEPHVFRIYDFEVDTVLNEIRIYSQSRTNDLGSNAIKNIVITDQTVQSALDDLKANLIEPTDISLVSDIPTKSSTKWSNRNPLNCIAGEQGSIIQIWGGEIQRDSRTIYVYKRRGLDNVGTIREGKHIEGLTISYSIDNLVTKIIPFRMYRDEEDFDTEIVEYGDEVVSPLHDKYSVSYIRFIDYSLDSDVRDLTSMNTKASNYFSSNTGIDEPRMTVDLDMLDLSKSADYKDKFKDFETFGLFDTIQVYSKKYNMILNAKINKVVYDSLNERNTELSIGNYRTGLIESVTSSYNSALEQKEKEINNQLYVAIRSADRKSTNFYGEAEPAGVLKDGDIWFKPTGDGHYQMYKYYSGSWGDPIIDTRQTDHLQTEILTVQSQAQQAVDEAEQATNEAIKAITGLEETNNQVLNIESRLDPTIPDSLAYQVASHTSTIAEQGGRLETLRGDFDGLEIGGRNYVPLSNRLTLNSTSPPNHYQNLDDGSVIIHSSGITYGSINYGGRVGLSILTSEDIGKEFISSFEVLSDKNVNIRYYTGLVKSYVQVNNLSNVGHGKWVRVWVKQNVEYTQFNPRISLRTADSTIRIRNLKVELGSKPTDWSPAPEDLATSKEFNDYKQTSEGYFQRIQSIETDLESGKTYQKIQDIKNTADRAESTLAQLTDGNVTAYNQKISTALGDIQTIKDADYVTQISNVAGRINVQIVHNSDGTKSMMDMTSNQLLYKIDGGKIQITKDKFYIDQTLIVPIIQTTKLSATQIESGTLDASKANIINLNAANIVGENANLVRGSFNAINTSISIDGTALTTKGNWGGDIKLSNRGLTIYDNLANREMGVLYGLFRNEDDPYKDRRMLATGLFANYGYKLNLGIRNETDNNNYSIISLDNSEEHGFPQMNVFGDILARYDLKMFGGMLTGAANAGYSVTEANGGHCIEFANGWKIQLWRSTYQTFSSGWTGWTFPKRFESIPRIVLAQAMRDDENLTHCNAYGLNYHACNIRIQDRTMSWTIVAIAIGR